MGWSNPPIPWAEFERNLRLQKDAVLKFMTIKVGDAAIDESVEISPEDIQFAAVEPMTEEEMDESREKLLGLVESHDRYSRDDRGMGARMDEDLDDEMDEGLDDDEETR